MTTEIPAPQIPEQLGELIDTWGRKHTRIGEIDGEIARIEPAMADLQRQLAELNNRHADLGRQRHEAVEEAKFARDMVEHGCQLAGAPVPPMPQATPITPAPAHLQPPAPTPRDVSGDLLAIPANRIDGPAPLPSGTTLTDPAPPAAENTGGDRPAEGGFRPEPDGDAEPRRRRGGRRGQ